MGLRLFLVVTLVALVGSIFWAVAESDVITGLRYVASDRWGVVTLADLALGLWFVGAWIAWREQSFVRAAPWWLGLCLLGNVVTLIYLLWRGFGAAPQQDSPNAASITARS